MHRKFISRTDMAHRIFIHYNFLWIDKRQPTKKNHSRKPIFLQWRAAWIWRDWEDNLRALWPVRVHMTHSSILFGVLRWRKRVHVSAELTFEGKNDNANDRQKRKTEKKRYMKNCTETKTTERIILMRHTVWWEILFISSYEFVYRCVTWSQCSVANFPFLIFRSGFSPSSDAIGIQYTQ